MSAADLLSQLQATFPSGQTSGTFDATQVQSGEYSALLTGLGIPTTLELSSPNGWQTDGTNVTLSGTMTTAVLGVSNAPVYFQFTPFGDDWVMLMDLTLPASWTFASSFSLLSAGVYADLTLDSTQPSALVIASGAAPDPQRTVSGTAITTAAGVNFFGYFSTNSSPLTQVAWILDGGSLGVVTGPIAFDASTGAVTMSLALATGTMTGLFGDSGPTLSLSLSLYSGLNTAINQYDAGILFEADLAFATTSNADQTIDLSALLVASDQPILDLTLSGSALAFPTPDTLAQFFGAGNGIANALPGQFNGGNLVQINAITFGVGLRSQSFLYAFLSVGALTGEEWSIWPNVIGLGNLNFLFSIFQPLGTTPSYAFTFSGVFTLGTVPIVIQAQLPGEILSGRLDPTQPSPSLVPLVQQVFGFTSGLPDELEILELDFSANIPQSQYSADLVIYGDWSFDFGTDNQVTFEELQLSFSYSPTGGAAGGIEGKFAVGTEQFTVGFDMTETNTKFYGAWEDAANPLTYRDIAIALGMYGLANLPQGIDLGLTGAEFEFDTSGPSFSFEIKTASYGSAALVAGKDATGNWGFIYGMIVGLSLQLDLTNIPVVGDLVPAGDDVISLNDLRIVAATTALPVYTATAALTNIFGGVVNSGLVLSIDLSVGTSYTESFSVRFGGSNDGTATDTPLPPSNGNGNGGGDGESGDALLSADAAPTTASPGPQATWVNVQRAFGPVQINRIGFMITTDDQLALLVDAGVSLDGLSIGLTGLEAAMPITAPFTPVFSLAGLTVQYVATGFSIGGGLATVPNSSPTEYTGDLIASFGSFGATLFGSYTTVNGSPSLFAFLFMDVPLGGPAFFFVTGLAGGFGYNRSLELPSISQVAAYPLVQGAMGTLNATQTQTALNQYISPAANEDWFAAGVRFTSYEMVKSFALLTVAFGTTLEIALMGESTLIVPPSTPEYPLAPVAEADLVLLVDVNVTAGYVAVNAELSPSSYVFSKAAQLTGGFAFYVWFNPSAYAGDFVVTLGGYNPYFTPPAYYPTVPRLGLNWQISTEMSIKGGLYFALTPSVIMAGGSLAATWQSSGIKAWFDAQADFLIRFKPFQYLIDVDVNVGASATLSVLGITKTITIHVGVGMAFWGPSFGGQATIDLKIISFTISFGVPKPANLPNITWTEFTQSFLPPATSTTAPPQQVKATSASRADSTPPTPTNSLITFNAPAGLLNTFSSGDTTVWAVDPSALQLVIGTQIPSKTVEVSPQTTVTPASAWNTQFGIGPMGIVADDLTVVDLNIAIDRDDATDDDDWAAAAVIGSVPAGLWLNTTNQMQTNGLVGNVLVGVTLTPAPPSGDETLPVPITELLTDDPPIMPLAWSSTSAPSGDSFDQSQAMQELQTTLVDTNVAASRCAILAALTSQGLTTASAVDVADFATNAPNLLFSPPQLRLLGEVPTT